MNHDGSSFLCGCAPFRDLIFFAKENDALAGKGVTNCSFFAMDREDWSKYDESVAWPAIAMATLKIGNQGRIVTAVGPSGQYWELDDLSLLEMMGEISSDRANIRALSVIADSMYACGMGRRVFLREALGRWHGIGPAEPLPMDYTIVGFEDISGFSENEIYAVGWQGEIWLRSESKWQQIDSPVSANLNAVDCAADGNVFIVGDNGVLLRGRKDRWDMLDTGRRENLMDVCYHGGTVFAVTDFRILKIQGDTLVDETDFAKAGDRPSTCLHLLPAQDGLISMGPKDLFRWYAGSWERVV